MEQKKPNPGAFTLQGRKPMQAVNFKMPSEDYAALKAAFKELGLTTGAGLRFALAEFMRNRRGQP